MSTNAACASALELMSRLMDLLGEDSFRSTAHARAARAIGASTLDVCAIARSPEAKAELVKIAGIGPKLADKIVEFASSGKIGELEKLAAQVPPGLLPLLQIQGLGPKTVRLLWQEAGVTDAASLKAALDSGKATGLPRMGPKAVEKLKTALAVASEQGTRLALGPAFMVARRVTDALKTVPGVIRLEPAGSLRRGKESVGDIDILCATTDAAGVIAAFKAIPEVRRVIADGEHRVSVLLAVKVPGRRFEEESQGEDAPAGPTVQVDLRVIPDESYGAALMYFTGSKEHNVRMRQRALDQGLTLNEFGLFPEDKSTKVAPHHRGVKPVAGKTEDEVFKALGLPYIPPEVREDLGEFDAKASPVLVEITDIKAELHAHTKASDGVMSIAALASEAKERGFHTVAVTDHSQSSAFAGGLKPIALEAHIEAVHAARAKTKGITILAGSEVDILVDGRLDYDDALLAKLDVVVASPHASLSQDSSLATARMVRAASHPLVHILGHPTGRLIMRRRGIEPGMAAVIAAAKKNNVALEINAHWMRLDLRDTHVRVAIEAGCLIAINCDVHHPLDFDNLRFGVLTARRGWVTPAQCINTWPADKLHAWLRSKRA